MPCSAILVAIPRCKHKSPNVDWPTARLPSFWGFNTCEVNKTHIKMVIGKVISKYFVSSLLSNLKVKWLPVFNRNIIIDNIKIDNKASRWLVILNLNINENNRGSHINRASPINNPSHILICIYSFFIKNRLIPIPSISKANRSKIPTIWTPT